MATTVAGPAGKRVARFRNDRTGKVGREARSVHNAGMVQETSSPVAVIQKPGLRVEVSPTGPAWLACALELVSVAELVSLLLAGRRTGRLDVMDSSGSRSLFLEVGAYTGSMSSHAGDRLGEVLLRTGKMTREQLQVAMEHVGRGKMLGRVLIELGFLKPSELRKALVDQALFVFQSACALESGHAVFIDDVHHTSPIRFGVATRQLVEEALQAEHRRRARAAETQPLLPEDELRVKRLCEAINLIMSALDDAGFGVGDQVREYVDTPPPTFEEALSGLSLAEPLEDKVALEHAAFIAGGRPAMIRSLAAVLEDALLQASDTLPEKVTDRLRERVRALGV